VPTNVPPQAPLYHFHVAPAPSEPPFTLKVVDVPRHIKLEPVMEVAGTELSLTVTVTDLQTVLLHVPSARTKYVVVIAGDTVSKDPVVRIVPPQLPLYHFHEAPNPKLPPDTDKVVAFPTQMVVVPEILTAGVDVSLTVTVKLLQMVLLHLPSARTK
jgi:hypothetical protein